MGVVFHAAGYLALWAAVRGFIVVNYSVLLVFGLVAASAVVWFDAGAVVTCMRNFPSERGTVAGELPSAYLFSVNHSRGRTVTEAECASCAVTSL